MSPKSGNEKPPHDSDETMDIDDLRKRGLWGAGRGQALPQDSASSEETLASGLLRTSPHPRLSWPARDSEDPPTVARPGQRRDENDEKTRLVGFGGPQPAQGQDASDTRIKSEQDRSSSTTFSRDPVVGWLVVTSGPGRGHSLELGTGANAIGRGGHHKVFLDYGDEHVSRDKHATLIFDPKHAHFFIERGDVRNLVYVNDELLLGARQLKGGEKIFLGLSGISTCEIELAA